MRGNRAISGGGLYVVNSAVADIINCIIAGNCADKATYGDGGGIYNNLATVNIYSSTIAGNYAYRRGGGVRADASGTTIVNSILWDNSSGGTEPQINGSPAVTYSDISGGFAGTGNINSDPLFLYSYQASYQNPTTSGDFHIMDGSPCIDAGTGAGAPADDFDEDTRTGNPDMGADEYVATTIPDAPTIGTPAALSSSSIRWNFTDNADNENGFKLHDASHAVKASSATHDLSCLDETGLSPNTQYTRHIHAYNAAGESTGSADTAAYTLSAAPNITADKSVSTWYSTTDVEFTNAAGFGDGGVQYYRYVWDQNSTHAFTDTETQWSAGTLIKTATGSGEWYLHVKSYNAEDVGSGTQDYGPYCYDNTAPEMSSLSPANGAVNVTVYSDLTFTLSDSHSGIDWTTFQIQLSGNKGYSQTYTDLDTGIVDKTGTAASYDVTVNPNIGFSNNEVITVTANVYDMMGIALTPPGWSFTTIASAAPAAPTIGVSVAQAADTIRWYFTDNADDETGFKVHDSSHTEMANEETSNLTYLDETGLTANTEYTRHIHAYNGVGDSAGTVDAAVYTLSPVPNVTADKSVSTWYSTTDVEFTNVAGFGAGAVEYYRYVWEQNSTHVFTDTETQWSTGTLIKTAAASGKWYLHVKSYNVEDAGSGTQDYGPYCYDNTAPEMSSLSPANEAVNVAVYSDLTFTLADSHSGIDWTTFQIQLSGDKGYAKTYTDLDIGIVDKTGTAASYDVTVSPDTDFSTTEVITVTVNVYDNVGIALTPPVWSFTTADTS